MAKAAAVVALVETEPAAAVVKEGSSRYPFRSLGVVHPSELSSLARKDVEADSR